MDPSSFAFLLEERVWIPFFPSPASFCATGSRYESIFPSYERVFGELRFQERGSGSENPRGNYVAQRRKPMTTHDCRSRQLPTNPNQASLPGPCALVTREYQCDSPSTIAPLLKSGLSRDGPWVAGPWRKNIQCA